MHAKDEVVGLRLQFPDQTNYYGTLWKVRSLETWAKGMEVIRQYMGYQSNVRNIFKGCDKREK